MGFKFQTRSRSRRRPLCPNCHLQWLDKHQKFDDWWKYKADLFNYMLEVRRLEAVACPDTPECLVVQIPLNRRQSELLTAIRRVLAQHYDENGCSA